MDRYNLGASPYVDLRSPFTAWEAAKLALLLPTVPLRLAAIFAAVVWVACVNSLAIFGCNLDKPLPRWRRRVVEVASSFASRVVLAAMGFWGPQLKGLHNYQRGQQMGALGCFNHVSYLDAFVVVWAFCASGVTFKFSQHLPILGYGVRALQNLYVAEDPARDKPPKQGGGAQQQHTQQRSSLVALIKERASNRDMPMLSLAPEGTLSNGRCLLTFKTGTFAVGAPVVPILLRYNLDAGCSPAWTLLPGSTLWHVLRLMCQLRNHVTVDILPPYVPSEAEKADPGLYAANVRRVMADALGVPLVDEDRSHFLGLVKARVGVSWDGRRLTAPPGVLDKAGCLDLAAYMPPRKER